MGLFDAVGNLFTGGGVKASRRGTRDQIVQAMEAIREGRQSDLRTFQELEPFTAPGRRLAGTLGEAATIPGFGARIDELSTGGALDPLVRERLDAVQNQLSASGLRRSGRALTEAARVPTETLFGVEGMLADRLRDVVGLGQTAGTNMASLREGISGNLRDLMVGIGDVAAGGRMNQAAARAGGLGQLLSLGGSALGAVRGAGGIGSLLSSVFSDRRLKTNIQDTGREIKGLTLYTWDWIEDAPDLVKDCPGLGFMADEVLEKFPDAVDEFAGYLTVDYAEVVSG